MTKFLAMIGSRSFDDYALLRTEFEKIQAAHGFTDIVSGGASGADNLAEQIAREHGLGVVVITPDWSRYGRGAGMVRNKEIIARADFVLAFWDGKSKGTAGALKIAEKLGKPRQVVHTEPCGEEAGG